MIMIAGREGWAVGRPVKYTKADTTAQNTSFEDLENRRMWGKVDAETCKAGGEGRQVFVGKVQQHALVNLRIS